jgi:four helix bundle protein
MNREDLEKRTKQFAVEIIGLVKGLPKNRASDVIAYQLSKSGTSIGANYREATRAESKDDFVHKLGLVLKEANETVYWLELIQESAMVDGQLVTPLLSEAKELLAIFGASHKTARKKS